MSEQSRRDQWLLFFLVIGLGGLFLTRCVAASAPAPQPCMSAGLCVQTCAAVPSQAPAPVALPTDALFLPGPQPSFPVVFERRPPAPLLVAQGVSLIRAPPLSASQRA